MKILLRERFSYAVGDLGFNLVWQSIELYLLFFYIEVMQLPLGIAASIFLIGAIADWLIDPAIGSVVDRFSDRVPMRRWVFISGPLLGLSLWLAFRSPPFDLTSMTAYAGATHLLLRFAYAAGNIPYAALTARMTDNPAEQLALTGQRMQGAALGGIIAAAVYAFSSDGSSEHQRFLTGALALGLFAQPCFLITWLGVKERIIVKPGKPMTFRGEMLAYFGLVTSSAPIRRLLTTIIAAGLTTTVTAKSILFFFDRDLHADSWGYWAALLPSIALLATTPLWVAFSRKKGLVATLILAAILHCVALSAMGISAGNSIGLSTGLLAVAIAASCGMSVMFWSLVPLAIRDLESRRNSESCAARVYALSNTSRKLGQALAPQIIALSLWFSGGTDSASKSGSVIPGLITAALICLLTVTGYRPNDQIRPQMAG